MARSEYNLGGVDGKSASAPGMAIITGAAVGTTLTLPHPSSWGIGVYWQPVQNDYEAKDQYRTVSRYRAGFRVRVEVSWGALEEAERASIIAKLNSNASLTVRFWPHVTNTNVYYDCNISEESNVDGYALGAPIGYAGTLVLVGKQIYESIPLFEKGYHYTEGRDPADYDDDDEVAYYTDGALLATYLATDKIAFYWRNPRSIGV